MGRRRNKPFFEKVTIESVGAEGKALARIENKVVFVPFAAPGDVVDIQSTRKKKSFLEGVVTKFHEYSPERVDPFCEHFGICGGCKWQHLSYNDQLKFKQQQVIDSLERIAKVPIPEIKPILGSKETRYYRNKLEFTFSNRRWLHKDEMDENNPPENYNAVGFHIPKLFDKVLDIEECHLQSEPSNKIRNEVRNFALDNNLSFFDIRNHHGLLRNLIIRNTSTNQLMVIVVFYENDEDKRNALLAHIEKTFPEITSLNYIINQKPNDSISDQDVINYSGMDHIVEEMEGLKFRIGPKSFYQTNSNQAYELYKVARELAGLQGDEIVYDLYTGTGTIANFVSHKAKKVIGVEYVEEAVQDAWVNSEINGITNTSFYAGDMKDILNTEFIEQNGAPDVIITDPPRAGMHTDVIETILRSNTKKIVYISCNPATQARDLASLDVKYIVKAIQPVDMFPHTHHIENIVLLEKKDTNTQLKKQANGHSGELH